MSISKDSFGFINDPITGAREEVERYTLSGTNGVYVQVITYGATITSICCPDKDGNIADIALGFDNIQGVFLIMNCVYVTRNHHISGFDRNM